MSRRVIGYQDGRTIWSEDDAPAPNPDDLADAQEELEHHPVLSLDELLIPLSEWADRLGYDYGVKLSTQHQTTWGCEVRITLDPGRPGGPDESRVWYAVGDPEEAMRAALGPAVEWLTEEIRQVEPELRKPAGRIGSAWAER